MCDLHKSVLEKAKTRLKYGKIILLKGCLNMVESRTQQPAKKKGSAASLLKAIDQSNRNVNYTIEQNKALLESLHLSSADNKELLRILQRLGANLKALAQSLSVPIDTEQAMQANEFNVYNFSQVDASIQQILKLLQRNAVINFDDKDTETFVKMMEKELQEPIADAMMNQVDSAVQEAITKVSHNTKALIEAVNSLQTEQEQQMSQIQEQFKTLGLMGLMATLTIVLGVFGLGMLVLGNKIVFGVLVVGMLVTGVFGAVSGVKLWRG